MRKIGIIAVLSLMALALTAVPALAANPHFLSASLSGPNANGNLTMAFRIAGLGNDIANVKITLSSNASALYACRNNGGNFPSDPKKQTVSRALSVSDPFPYIMGRRAVALLLVRHNQR
jgi:hypothetical protein